MTDSDILAFQESSRSHSGSQRKDQSSNFEVEFPMSDRYCFCDILQLENH